MAWTSFAGVAPDGCTHTDTYLLASDEVVRTEPGGPVQASQLLFSAHQWSDCNGVLEDLRDLFTLIDVPAEALQVQGHLHGATLDVAFEAFDYVSGTRIPVTLHLAWTGEGTVTRSSSTAQTIHSNYRYSAHWNGDSRPALVTGTLTLPGTTLDATSTAYSGLTTNRNGSLTVARGF
jgi:hypothetical protein